MTQCSETLFQFEAHFSRQVVAEFSGAPLTTEGGSLLLRQADRKIGLLRRAAACFTDCRQQERIEHRLEEMLAQRIYGLALGYEDLNDHEQLRQDPLLAVLAGKKDLGEPLAGKSTLNRLELTPVGSPVAERYHKISYCAEAIWKRTRAHRARSCWTWTPPTRRCTDGRKRVFSTAITGTTVICRCMCSAEIIYCVRGCDPRTSTRAREVCKKCGASCGRFARGGRRPASSCERTRASAGRSCWRGANTTKWTMCSALRGTGVCDGSSAARCSKPSKNTGARENRRGCSVSSLIAPKKAGRGRGA